MYVAVPKPPSDTWFPLTQELPLEFAIQLQYLQELSAALPASAPMGKQQDDLGAFGESPSQLANGLAGDELWERIDPMLNKVLGYGCTVKELAKTITKGRYGVIGLHNTFVWLALEGGIAPALLEGKLTMLVEATKAW